ncbi:piggyBac transposable element-derived protein 4-like isoform X1 [Limulus polyphemus]|uniref:PiggyBac transposable element-derived protein 4-like isoform X1 n=3 Tax=Limulus polyphemus TaxID=6850 RepID=A0ABM1SYU8_LIMPO|nr:piggyBac transposable element-derived protein 4-like isoform X1 [Limulus polyphemus]XP_022248804.1 piggyBac transposable element-derived protein 4-like isoform X1 [Limulus polyphemus]XP_022248805.1 piggyBac transposable element-derived protein 4-like isoform X1 [Limulus polyphemus]
MEVLEMKVEPFSDEEQNVLLDIKHVKNETIKPSPSSESTSIEDRSSSTVFEFDIAKDELEENSDEEIEMTENFCVSVKTEQPDDLEQDEIVSVFNVSDDDDQDSSKDDPLSMKKENEFQDEFLHLDSESKGGTEMASEQSLKESSKIVMKKRGYLTMEQLNIVGNASFASEEKGLLSEESETEEIDASVSMPLTQAVYKTKWPRNPEPALLDSVLWTDQDVAGQKSRSDEDIPKTCKSGTTKQRTRTRIRGSKTPRTTVQEKPLICNDSWTWVEVCEGEQPQVTSFVKVEPVLYQANQAVTVMDCFKLFFSIELLSIIVNQTNAYANDKIACQNEPPRKKSNNKWIDVTVEDILAYLGITIAMGLRPYPFISDYWSTYLPFHAPWFTNVMSRERFQAINNYLHFNNSANSLSRTNLNHDKLFKIKPVLDILLKSFETHYHPNMELSIDEQMLGTKSRIGFLQYLPKKPVKWGIKVWVLAEALSGYCLKFKVYTGKKGEMSAEGLADNVVMELMDKYNRQGHWVFMDNFYTSPCLFDKLLAVGTYACGTCKNDRLYFPQELIATKLQRGEAKFFKCGSLTAVKWTDRQDIYALSTLHSATMTTVTKRGRDTEVTKPQLIVDYNKFMGVVDLNDQHASYYSCGRKTIKWYKKLFFRLLDLTIVNAYVLYKKQNNQPALSQKTFRKDLVTALVGPLFQSRPGLSGISFSRTAQELSPLRLTLGRHFPTTLQKGKRKRCRLCLSENKVQMQCKLCLEYLCMRHFEEYHTSATLQRS